MNTPSTWQITEKFIYSLYSIAYMPTTITTRVEDTIVLDIDAVASQEAIDRSAVIRKFLIRSLKEWKIQRALEAYEQGKTTLWKAAKDCGISLWEMIEEVKTRDVHVPYRLEDFKDDLRAL